MASNLCRQVLPRHVGHRDEKGVILVLWALCLGVLIACMALAINLGNLSQQAVNIQNAADSGALAGAGEMASQAGTFLLPWVTDCSGQSSGNGQSPDFLQTCACPTNLNQCSTYSWLDPYYVYNDGWQEIVDGPTGVGQINDQQAFFNFAHNTWTCAVHLQHICEWITTNVTGSEDGALSDGTPATVALNIVTLMQQDYRLAGSWSDCPQPQSPLSVAKAGQPCIAYYIGRNYVLISVTVEAGAGTSYFVNDHVATLTKSAWAVAWGTGPPTLCSPAGTCPTPHPDNAS